MSSGGPSEPCIRWGLDTLMGRGNFKAKGAARCEVVASVCRELSKKRLNWSRCRMRFGLRKHALRRVHTGATWRIPSNRPRVAAMRPDIKLLWPLVEEDPTTRLKRCYHTLWNVWYLFWVDWMSSVTGLFCATLYITQTYEPNAPVWAAAVSRSFQQHRLRI